MPLTPGSRLGGYEILGPLGVGGMGEVWRARDLRLSREVAIKVLPAELATDPSRLKRFEREARATSALNHPNIVTIYEIGSAESVTYIAMERVEGKTLRELLFGGAIPTKKLLPIAAQIADGLARAHDAGIVHRDLKPENVMVTKDGLVKILDFGLAKRTDPGSGSDEGSHIPTETGTSPGVVLGTVGYMSPEQAAGQPVDFRSDQFSFGSILYEMATGKRAFQKGTAVDTLSAILHDEPEPVGEINPQAPAPLRWIVERCLGKDPDTRYASTEDLARELKTISAHLSDAAQSQDGETRSVSPGRRRLRNFVAALLVAAAGVFVGARLMSSRTVSPPRFQQVTFQKANISTAAFAPDGQTIVYSARRADGRLELFQTRPGSRGSRPMGISDGLITSISRLGEMALIRESDESLATAPLGGGEPRPSIENVSWADWAPDGKSLAIVRHVGERGRVEFPVGTPLYEGGGGRIRVSPRGDAVVFKAGSRLAFVDRTKIPKMLVGDAHEFGWSPDGEEIWFTRIADGSTHVFAITLAGRERPLASLPGDFTLYAVSREGRILFERGFEQWQVVGRFPGDDRDHGYKWLDATVVQDLSPDGKTLVFVEKEPGWKNATSYVRKTDGSPAVPLAEGFCRCLSPDGKWLICKPDLVAQSLDLVSVTGETRHLPNATLEFRIRGGVDWLPDGRSIVFTANAPGHASQIFVQAIDGSPPVPVTPEHVEMFFLAKAVSPDGQFVVGLRQGVAALYPLKGGAAVPIAGVSAGDLPMQWNPDGTALYLQREDAPGKVWLLDRATGVRRLFKEFQPAPTGPGGGWIFNTFITPDGRYYASTYQGFLADLFVLDGVR